MTAGETLGEAVLSDGGKRKASCVTEEPTEMLVLKKYHFDLTFKKFLERGHEEKVDFLARVECFASWSRERLSNMANYCRERKYRAGEVVICQGNSADSIFFIKSGLVSILRTLRVDVANRPIICDVCVARVCARDVFGETTVLDSEKMGVFPSSAVCETHTVCFRLDKVQIIDGDWDKKTLLDLKGIAVVYPEDSILLQAHVDHLQFKKQSAQIIKNMRRDPKKRQRGR